MSYNNIGLPTPRGTGTSGYITRNLSSIVASRTAYRQNEQIKKLKETRPPNPQILLHQRKRALEAQVLQYKEDLIIQGITDPEEIKQKADEYRQQLKDEGFLEAQGGSGGTHQLSFEKQKELEKLKTALGISDDHESGKVFDFEAQEQMREQKAAERMEKLKQKVASEGGDVKDLLKPPPKWLDRVDDKSDRKRRERDDDRRRRERDDDEDYDRRRRHRDEDDDRRRRRRDDDRRRRDSEDEDEEDRSSRKRKYRD